MSVIPSKSMVSVIPSNPSAAPAQQHSLHLPVPEANSLSAFLSGACRQQRWKAERETKPVPNSGRDRQKIGDLKNI